MSAYPIAGLDSRVVSDGRDCTFRFRWKLDRDKSLRGKKVVLTRFINDANPVFEVVSAGFDLAINFAYFKRDLIPFVLNTEDEPRPSAVRGL
jgi:hypothetical protein